MGLSLPMIRAMMRSGEGGGLVFGGLGCLKFAAGTSSDTHNERKRTQHRQGEDHAGQQAPPRSRTQVRPGVCPQCLNAS